jgi:YbbR domain-containing protein
MAQLPPAARDGGRRFPAAVLPRLGISLLLALLLWGWVTTQRDPTVARDFAGVPIAAPALPDRLQIAGDLGAVSITVEGPRSAVDALGRADIRPELVLEDVSGPGSYTLPITVPLPAPVRIDDLEPSSLAVVVDETTSRTIPLDLRADPPADGSRRLGEIRPEYSEVTVSGPRRLVDEVARVVLPIEIGDRTDDFTGQFSPLAVDAEGQPIPEVDIRPRRIIADVEVVARGRSVPVLVQTVGNPAPGYETVDRVVTPQTVLLDGPEAVLTDLVSVLTEPVSVDGADEPVSARVGLAGLPAGVRVVEPADGLVTAVVQVRQRGITQTLEAQPVMVTDVESGLTARVQPERIAVVISAGEDTLAMLRAGAVRPSVSAAGLGPGTYELPIAVAVPSGVQWIRADPEVVQVILSRTVQVATPVGPRERP